MGKSCPESQNGWAWKGFLKVTWSSLLIKQIHLEPVVQDSVQLGFDCLHRWRLHHHSGQPAPVERCFQRLEWNHPCFHLCPLLLVLSLDATGKSLTESSSHAPLKVSIYIDKIPTESSLAQRRLFWPWIHFSCHISSLTMGKTSPWVFAHADKRHNSSMNRICLFMPQKSNIMDMLKPDTSTVGFVWNVFTDSFRWGKS